MRTVGLLACCVLAIGCVASDDEDNEMLDAWRTGGWPSPATYPGNGDLAIYEGASTASADCLIYDFVGPNVHDGKTGDLLVTITGDAIEDADGNTLCVREGDFLVDRVRTGDPDGPVLFTTFGRWVFEGELDFAGDDVGQVLQELSEQLLFTYQGPHVWAGAPGTGDVVATSTKPLTLANTTRKLVVAAMLTAECGGLGLPPAHDH